MICKKCGAEIKSTLKFCNKCGAKIVLEEIKTTVSTSQNIPVEKPKIEKNESEPSSQNISQNTISDNRNNTSQKAVVFPTSAGILRLTVKNSANPLALADGSIYRFIIDSINTITIISEKEEVSKNIELACGQHNITLEVYGYQDTKLEKPPIHTAEKQTFKIYENQTVEIIANRASAFGSQSMIIPSQNHITTNSITSSVESNTKQRKREKTQKPVVPLKPKNKVIAGLFAILLGFFGIHWFYLGKPVRAIIYLVVYIFCPFIWLLYIVEGIYFLCAKQESFDKYRSKW